MIRDHTVAISPRNQLLSASFNPKAFLGRPGLGKAVKKYSKNDEIFTQGEAAGDIFYIQKGKKKASVFAERRTEAVNAIMGQGQFFGEGCRDGAKLRTSTVHAMEECLFTSITKAEVIEMLE